MLECVEGTILDSSSNQTPVALSFFVHLLLLQKSSTKSSWPDRLRVTQRLERADFVFLSCRSFDSSSARRCVCLCLCVGWGQGGGGGTGRGLG